MDWAFERYESVRGALPVAEFPEHTQAIDNLGDITEQIDVFLLDVFGVLSVGDRVVSGAVAAVKRLQDAGKQVFVLTNSASLSAREAQLKYQGYGFDFAPKRIISSREALRVAMRGRHENTWGVAAAGGADLSDLARDCVILGDEAAAYDRADGFVLLSALDWTVERQNRLLESLKMRPRPVLVGNPDIVAPRGATMSIQIGHYGHEVAARTGVTPEFYGKPFENIYELAMKAIAPETPRHRIAMVGDTLHTDILGGAAMGLKTVLITGHGVFCGREVGPYIAQSGLRPDWIAPGI